MRHIYVVSATAVNAEAKVHDAVKPNPQDGSNCIVLNSLQNGRASFPHVLIPTC